MSDVTKATATVSWKASKSDGGSPIKHYIIELKDSYKSFSQVGKVPADQLNFELTKLKENQQYHVRITAENAVGKSKPLEIEKPITPTSPFSKSFCSVSTFMFYS